MYSPDESYLLIRSGCSWKFNPTRFSYPSWINANTAESATATVTPSVVSGPFLNAMKPLNERFVLNAAQASTLIQAAALANK
jgi:hypothetical protein